MPKLAHPPRSQSRGLKIHPLSGLLPRAPNCDFSRYRGPTSAAFVGPHMHNRRPMVDGNIFNSEGISVMSLMRPHANRFEACSGFTHVTAHRIPHPPEAAFVTRLQPFRFPGRAARQLPDQSTTLWVDSSSTGNSRLRGALPKADKKPTFLALPGHRVTMGNISQS